MAHSNAAAAHTNNALTNPDPPEISSLLSDLSRYQETQAQLELLQKMSEVQNSRVQSLQERLQPLSPSGQIEGLEEQHGAGGYFDGAGAGQLGEPGQYDLDLDSFVQDNDYFPNHGGGGGGVNGGGADVGNAGGLPDFNYDMPDAGAGMNGGGVFGGGGFGAGAAVDPFQFDDVANQPHGQGQDETAQLGVDSASSSGTSPAATVEEVEDESRRRSPKRSRR
jgi:heat shock transcription factor